MGDVRGGREEAVTTHTEFRKTAKFFPRISHLVTGTDMKQNRQQLRRGSHQDDAGGGRGAQLRGCGAMGVGHRVPAEDVCGDAQPSVFTPTCERGRECERVVCVCVCARARVCLCVCKEDRWRQAGVCCVRCVCVCCVR